METRDAHRCQETSLPEREALIRSVINNLPQTIIYQIMAQPGGLRHFTYLSGAVTELFGSTPEEAMADPDRIYGRFAPADRDRVAREEEIALRDLAPFRTELPLRLPSGRDSWIYAASAPRHREDGTVVWDGIIIDITGRKRAEQALRG